MTAPMNTPATDSIRNIAIYIGMFLGLFFVVFWVAWRGAIRVA